MAGKACYPVLNMVRNDWGCVAAGGRLVDVYGIRVLLAPAYSSQKPASLAQKLQTFGNI